MSTDLEGNEKQAEKLFDENFQPKMESAALFDRFTVVAHDDDSDRDRQSLLFITCARH